MILIKRIIIAVFLLFLVVYNGQAQVSGKHKIVALSEADTGNSKFFHQNKQIQNIRILLYADNKKMAYIYFNNDSSYTRRAYVEPDYIVDSFVLFKKYGALNIPYSPDFMRHPENSDLKIYSIRLSKDSIRYILYPKEVNDPKVHIYGDAAKSNFNIKQFTKRIMSYKGKINPVDSVIVFRGTVLKSGVLNDLELWVGEQNPYTNFVRDELLLQKNNWTPALYWETNGKWTSDIRIYIQRSKDKTVTFLTSPRKLYNITGK